MRRSVSVVRGVVLTHRLLVRQLLTRGRMLALLALGAVAPHRVASVREAASAARELAPRGAAPPGPLVGGRDVAVPGGQPRRAAPGGAASMRPFLVPLLLLL